MKKRVSLKNLFENGIPCLEFGGTIKFHKESDNDYDLINDTTQEVIIRNDEQLEFGEWCHDETDDKFIVGTSDSGKKVYFSKEEYDLAVTEKQSIELGKEYLFAGYKWTACEMINGGKTVVLQSHGVTAGVCPKMLKFGGKIDEVYASDIDGEDISAYDDKMQTLYNTIKEVEDTSASYGKGLYLISKGKVGFTESGEPGSGYYWQALKMAANNAESFGLFFYHAWLGTVYGSDNAWYVISNGDVYGNSSQNSDFVVAPAFNLDLSKVEIRDDEIAIIDGEKSQTSQAFEIQLTHMLMCISLSPSDRKRIKDVLGISSYDEIQVSIVEAYSDMLDKIEKIVAKPRKIILQDGTCMGDETLVFLTNAPKNRLKSLEKEACDIYKNGGSYEDVPLWANVLTEEGYIFELQSCENPEGIQELYVIENQPELI